MATAKANYMEWRDIARTGMALCVAQQCFWAMTFPATAQNTNTHAVEVETWFISGQSNAEGYGYGRGLPGNELVKGWDAKTETWIPCNDPLPMIGRRGQVGPWHAAALEVVARTNIEIHLTGRAEGGTSIKRWAPSGGTCPFLSPVLKKSGRGADVFLWYQGESDVGMETALYQQKLKELLAAIRSESGNPKMLAVVIQLANHRFDADPGIARMDIREAQRRFVLEDGNAVLVPAIGLPLNNKDPVHLSAGGQFGLGKRIGKALLKVRHGMKDVNWPGPVLDAAVLDADGKTVVAHFAEVEELKDCVAEDFKFMTGSGKARTLGASPTTIESGNTVVRLAFAEPVKLPGVLCYAPGHDPKAALKDEGGNVAPAVQIDVVKGPLPADEVSAAPNGAGRVTTGR